MGPLFHAHQRIHRQRVDVVERQRAEKGQAGRARLVDEGRLHPNQVLRDVGQHVAVQKNSAFGDPGGAAGILQEGDVLGPDRHVLQLAAAPFAQRRRKRDVAGQRPARHQLLHAPDHQVDHGPLERAEQIAQRRDHHQPGRRARQHGLQGGGEILQDDDRFRAGIGELLLELARRVERIDVDHRHAGPEHADHGDGVLKDVGHHQRDPRTPRQSPALQERRKGGRPPLEVFEADRPPHAAERRRLGVAPAGRHQQLADRSGRKRSDLPRHARGIARQPRLGGRRRLRLARPRLAFGLGGGGRRRRISIGGGQVPARLGCRAAGLGGLRPGRARSLAGVGRGGGTRRLHCLGQGFPPSRRVPRMPGGLDI